jgi:hypothetical protein
MCDSRNAVPRRPRPRWNLLFAILPATATALAMIELTVASPPLRIAANATIVLAEFGAMAWWVRANRAALDQVDVCAFGPGMLTIREIRSRPEDSARPGAPASLPAPTPVSASPGHHAGARLRA